VEVADEILIRNGNENKRVVATRAMQSMKASRNNVYGGELPVNWKLLFGVTIASMIVLVGGYAYSFFLGIPVAGVNRILVPSTVVALIALIVLLAWKARFERASPN